MRRKLLLLNLALLVLGAAAAWQLRSRWLAGQGEERSLLKQPATPAGTALVPQLDAPRPVQAANYSDVAQKMLFTPDRNPDIAVETAPPKPVPPFPVAYGMMDLGDGPVVILSEKAGTPNRGYSAGQKIGEFNVAAVEPDAVVFEWDGKQFRKTMAELKPPANAQPATAAASPASSPASPGTAAPVQAVTAAVNAGPGEVTTADQRACVPGDDSPDGTIRDGYRKVLKRYLFTITCHWEKVK